MEPINEAYDILYGKLTDWLKSFIEMLPNYLVAVLVFVGFYFLAQFVKKGARSLFNRLFKNPAINKLFSQIIFLLVIVFGFLVALDIVNLDKTITSLLAGAGIMGLAVSLAFQDLVTNFVSGISIAVRKPYVVGDIIETNDYFGTVEKVDMRSTVIKLPQGPRLIIPNKMIFQNPMINYTHLGKRRIDLKVGISYHDDLEKVEKVTTEAVRELKSIIEDGKVEFFYEEFGDSSINFVVRFWIEYKKQSTYKKEISNAIKSIQKAYNEEGITIPFPIRTLDFDMTRKGQLKYQLNNADNNSQRKRGEA